MLSLKDNNRKGSRLIAVISLILVIVGATFFGISVYLAVKGSLISSLISLAAGFASITSGAEIVKEVS